MSWEDLGGLERILKDLGGSGGALRGSLRIWEDWEGLGGLERVLEDLGGSGWL